MDWILLRGLAREASHWGGFVERLQSSRPGDRFHLLDLPGTGIHHQSPAPRSLRETRLFLEKAYGQRPRPFGLIGLSLGGMVALDWAQQRPDHCAALVLINTSSGFSRPWQRLRPANWPAIVRLLLSADLTRRELGILTLTSNTPLAPQVAEDWIRIQRERPVSRVNVLRQLSAASRFKPNTLPPAMPSLVLASKGDRLVDWRCSQKLAHHWQCPLVCHDSAGHDLPLDDPDWVVQQINRHFPARIVPRL